MTADIPGSGSRNVLDDGLDTGSRSRVARIGYPSDHGGRHEANVLVGNSREKIQGNWSRGVFYEAHRHGMLNTVYRMFRGGTFVDVGAAIGNHSLFFSLCCNADRVISIEPVPRLCERLTENLRLNGLDVSHVHNVALGARPGEVGMAFRELPIEQGGMLIGCIDEGGKGTRMDTLDNIIAAEAPVEIRCIKIDVEGYSLPMLKGARETVSRYHPAIFCECETRRHFDEVDEFLSAFGYRAWMIRGRPFAMNHTATYLWEYLQTSKIVVAITSYNRPGELAQLLYRLRKMRGAFDVTCLVYDDCSTLAYEDLSCREDGFEVRYRRMHKRSGKTRYWRLINRIFSDLRDMDFDYFMQLPDDVVPVEDFFSRAVRTWDAIDDPDKISLNLYLDNSRIARANWTKTLPTIERFGDINVFRTGWMDMIFMADRRFLASLKYRIDPIPENRWSRNPKLSSGVGLQIGMRLKNHSFYQVRQVLLESLDLPSQMHPNRPAEEDLSSAEFDPVVCGIASIPERQKGMEKAIEPILPCVDELHVYLNNYRRVPKFLSHPKISVYRSQEYGDIGDAGKFFRVGEVKGFYLAIDDDIFYPDDFVWRMICEIRRNRAEGKHVAIGMHGRIMAPEVESYYRGHRRIIHFGGAVDSRTAVHVLGTGVLAFHTGDLRLCIDDFEGPRNMADIYFALACQRQNVGCVVLPHESNYLQRQEIPGSKTIWGTHRTSDIQQSRLYNSWKDWKLRT